MHTPVLLNEVIQYLNPGPGDRVIDATINGGGHALAVIERILPSGRLLGIEIDENLYEAANVRLSGFVSDGSLVLVNDSYTNIGAIARERDFDGVRGIIFDLGMSSWHIEEAGRGFTFQKDEPLDMRFSRMSGGLSAQDILNRSSYEELARILREYGEERFAKSIAAGIVKIRKEKTIATTLELVDVIKMAAPFWYRRGRIHFATRTFQALRIAVNSELENIATGLGEAVRVLGAGGRLAVISFHSLEDRIVKNFFKNNSQALKIITKKPIIAEYGESKINPRSRSAKLRIAEKI